MKTAYIDTASGAGNRQPLISAVGFAILSVALCLLASGIAGRATDVSDHERMR